MYAAKGNHITALMKYIETHVMPLIFSYDGAKYYIRTRDHHPAHVHVKTADGEIRIYLGREDDGGSDNYGRSLGETERVWGKIKSSTIRTLVEHLKQNRAEAWETWHQIYG